MVDAAGAQVSGASARFQERLRERARAQRRLSALTWARRLGIAAGILALLWVVLWSPVFALDTNDVTVTGYGTVVDPEQVDAVLADFKGQSLATLSTASVEAALLEVRGVRSAVIDRAWPAGLLVELTSREPVAAVPAGKGYDFIDAQATKVGSAKKAPKHLPVVTVPVGEDKKRVLAAVLSVINQMPVDLRDRVQNVSAKTEDTVSFELRDGPRVEWGSAEDSALKAEVLAVLLTAKESKKAAVIDVSAPTLPTTKQ